MSDPGPEPILDIAVVGGGAGGAYAAYRLMQAKPGDSPTLDALRKGKSSLSVKLFEESLRLGGRLWSLHHGQLPEIPIELGGQGFSELQQNVYGLCTRELRPDLTVVDCPAFSLGPQLQYQRRHRFPYKAYSPLPPEPSTLSGLSGAERAAELRTYRAFIVQLCPSVPPLPEPLDKAGMDKIAAWCDDCKQAVQNTPDYYPGVVPYFLHKQEEWTDPFQLLIDVILKYSPALADAFHGVAAEVQKNGASSEVFARMNALQDLLRTTNAPTGQALDAHGFWNILSTQVSSEAYSMSGFASFASSSMGNWNLYDSSLAMFWGTLIYMMKTPFYSIQEGYDQLPNAMLKRFRAAGGHVASGQRVVEIGVDESSGERLVSLTISSADEAEPRTVYARYAVLALPKAALELMRMNGSLGGNALFTSDVQSVVPVPASKVFLVYPEPWWQRSKPTPITGGYSTTDLPVRACYYMGTQPDGRSLLLATLNDDEAQTFWAAYEKPSGSVAGQSGISPQAMIDQLQSQLAEMHGLEPPLPVAGPIYFNWAIPPFGGGWHNWRPGLKSWEVIPRIRRMSVGNEADARVFLCGEAYSNQQGWVEGALNTAEMALETYFGLPRPNWVADTYNFGP